MDKEIISAKELLKANIPKIEYLVEDIIPRAGLVYCFGSPGSFKTNFLLYTAISGSEGKDVFNFKIQKKFRTLWLDEENREIGMKDKLCKIFNGMEVKEESLENIQISICANFNILGKKSLEKLDEWITKYKPDMVVIDSIAKVFPLSERDEGDVRKIYTFLSPFIKKYGVTFILIHHARKRNFLQVSKDMEDISGSREFGAMADSILLLDEVNEGKYLLKQVKNRYSSKVYAENFEVTGNDEKIEISYMGKVKDAYLIRVLEVKSAISKWIGEKKITKFKRKEAVDVMKTCGYKESNIDKALKLLKSSGELTGEYGEYVYGK